MTETYLVADLLRVESNCVVGTFVADDAIRMPNDNSRIDDSETFAKRREDPQDVPDGIIEGKSFIHVKRKIKRALVSYSHSYWCASCTKV